MKLYICEKPSQGRDLAAVLGCRTRGEGCLKNGDSVVTWCFGHLLELQEPSDYDPRYKRWNLEDLPIIPPRYAYKVKKASAKQYKAVHELVKQASEIYIATDYDREGEAIARSLLERFRYGGPIFRVCLTALDDTSIRRALGAIKNGSETEPLYRSALGRSRADWLVGMNLSRLFSVLARQSGFGSAVQIGRVLTPTVTLVVNRDNEIDSFVPVPFFELLITAISNKGAFKAKWKVPEAVADEAGRCLNRETALATAAKVNNQPGVITRAERKRQKENPPLPFDLTSLQRFASRRFGYSAQKTLEILQGLYETRKATTYPRTDCRYIPESQYPDAQIILEKIAASDPALAPYLPAPLPARKPRCFNTPKVEAHHAIIPTTKVPDLSELAPDERNIYNAVRCFYIIQFLPEAEYDRTLIELACQDELFAAGGRTLANPGFKKLLDAAGLVRLSEQSTDDDEAGSGGGAAGKGKATTNAKTCGNDNGGTDANADIIGAGGGYTGGGAEVRDPSAENTSEFEFQQQLPQAREGDPVTVTDPQVQDRMTSPPSHFTEAALLAAMEHIGRYVTEERFKKILKETAGIGTPATRAAILESAISHDYLMRKAKYILSTSKARSVIPALPEGIKSAGLTAAWEQELDKIAHRQADLSEFMTNIEKWIRGLIAKYQEPGRFAVTSVSIASGNAAAARKTSAGSAVSARKTATGSAESSRETSAGFGASDRKASTGSAASNGKTSTRARNFRARKTSADSTRSRAGKSSSILKARTEMSDSRYNGGNTGENQMCPACGRPMVKRKASRDGSEFWGCSGYPECRKTLPISGNHANGGNGENGGGAASDPAGRVAENPGYSADRGYQNQGIPAYSDQGYPASADYPEQRYQAGQDYSGQGYPAGSDFSGQEYPEGSDYSGRGYQSGPDYSSHSYPNGQNYSGQGYPSEQGYFGQGFQSGMDHFGQSYPDGGSYSGESYPTGPDHYGQGYPAGQDYESQGYPDARNYSQDGYPAGSDFVGQSYPDSQYPSGQGRAGYQSAQNPEAGFRDGADMNAVSGNSFDLPGSRRNERNDEGKNPASPSENSNRDANGANMQKLCPDCGRPMVKRRSAKTGNEFWGCSGYPECRCIVDENRQSKPRAPADPSAPACPNCGKPMVKRKSSKTGNEFWGCSGFPNCRGLIDIDGYNKGSQSQGGSFKPKSSSSRASSAANSSFSSNENDAEAPKCPKCGRAMKRRKSNKTGNEFWGCSGYPECRGIVFDD
ncbi:MAG: topoisomerase DNA-binding C4 zinc finger domain-containing protein [Succinivibrionaceae bacterium]|nr:topoisomerase DNA-binding C4 zinc finger domain-containing protein [Succinivibrionaceae bacterium]